MLRNTLEYLKFLILLVLDNLAVAVVRKLACPRPQALVSVSHRSQAHHDLAAGVAGLRLTVETLVAN